MMESETRGARMREHRRSVPGTLSTVWTLAGITLKRLGRGKALWIALLFAALPVVYATIVRGRGKEISLRDLFNVSTLLLAIVPAMFVSASIGEEIEERTSTYLWSRPIARWAVLAGKLIALVPLVIALVVGGWYGGLRTAQASAPLVSSCAALATGCVAASLIAAGIATVLPKHGMSLTIGYMLVDVFIGALPFSLRELSITHQTVVLSRLGLEPPATSGALIAMGIVAGVWGVVSFARIQRLET
jgi:ABC-type transport system involved in multi-copper enzyme maturation permease subunit